MKTANNLVNIYRTLVVKIEESIDNGSKDTCNALLDIKEDLHSAIMDEVDNLGREQSLEIFAKLADARGQIKK